MDYFIWKSRWPVACRRRKPPFPRPICRV